MNEKQPQKVSLRIALRRTGLEAAFIKLCTDNPGIGSQEIIAWVKSQPALAAIAELPTHRDGITAVRRALNCLSKPGGKRDMSSRSRSPVIVRRSAA